MENILTMKNLEACFNIAKEEEMAYVGIKITVPNSEVCEVIINPTGNFDNKLEYYKRAYNEDLTLKTFNKIKIVGFTWGNQYAEIEQDLIW